MLPKIDEVVEDLKAWTETDITKPAELEQLSKCVGFFEHCSYPDHHYSIAGADGSGAFPVATYQDTFLHLVTAEATLYETFANGLKELPVDDASVAEVLMLPEDAAESKLRMYALFEKLVGIPLLELCHRSDYLQLRNASTRGRKIFPTELCDNILTPRAHDADNVRIHLLAAAELCSLLRCFAGIGR